MNISNNPRKIPSSGCEYPRLWDVSDNLLGFRTPMKEFGKFQSYNSVLSWRGQVSSQSVKLLDFNFQVLWIRMKPGFASLDLRRFDLDSRFKHLKYPNLRFSTIKFFTSCFRTLTSFTIISSWSTWIKTDF